MVDFAKLHGSPDPKNDAQWFNYYGAEFLIAPADNPGFNIAALKKMKMKEAETNASVYDSQKPQIEIVAEYILLGWKGVEVDGKELAYSPSVAAEFMLQYPSVLAFVQETAGNLRQAQLDNLGNLSETKKK